ncbi:hypothetical protein EOA23_09005 [Mesorhizobium sp. M2A.F.Ca.ET.042.01.1.1]|uniref:C-type lectin domain-containing protein n=1 Tax=Mesorhizobium sp. M2A.F.Ca.ET.042.01.1.1 TaxID=2496745 RepID=UPI000FCB87E3|nr:C-type lectin domain-containing protein [Mesorhizobium sp. M2A.F.Ca.ET.042.01.1.1]RUX32490.1 hypothetical protein EOA23_09005 [Mesorhizobium sp. M2A.F.Ca.ET.042.01.1.1]
MTDIFQHTLVHPIHGEVPLLPFDKKDAEWDQGKVATARRLIAAYKATMSQESPLRQIMNGDLWSALTRDHFGQLLGILHAEDAEQLSRYLVDFGREYTWFGGITTGVDGYTYWDRDDRFVAYSYFDKLVCLGEALGVLSAESPEQGPLGKWGNNIQSDPEGLVRAIEAQLGIKIVPPQGTVHVAGLSVGSGLLHYRHINAVYLATRIRDFAAPQDRICEFGGGLGLAAYYLNLFGRKNVTIFDLPIVNILSGYFLIGTLGQEAVCLEGEEPRPDTIAIRANWNCEKAADGAFRITANQDSFPEINRRIFDEYVEQIRRTTSGFFLSINHEGEQKIAGGEKHLHVSKLLSTSPDFHRMYRSPYWLRRGYVEELYRIV